MANALLGAASEGWRQRVALSEGPDLNDTRLYSPVVRGLELSGQGLGGSCNLTQQNNWGMPGHQLSDR